MGQFQNYLTNLGAAYMMLQGDDLDLFYASSKKDGKYLFALSSRLSRDRRPDGSVEFRERDQGLVEKILPEDLFRKLKSGEEHVFPYAAPACGDNFNAESIYKVRDGKVVLLKSAEI